MNFAAKYKRLKLIYKYGSMLQVPLKYMITHGFTNTGPWDWREYVIDNHVGTADPMTEDRTAEQVMHWCILREERHAEETVKEWFMSVYPYMILHEDTFQDVCFMLHVSDEERLNLLQEYKRVHKVLPPYTNLPRM